MNRTIARLLLATACLVVGVAVISLGRPVPEHPASDVLDAGSRASMGARWRTQVDTVKRGEALLAVLQRVGMSREEAQRALRSVPSLNLRRIRPGTLITARTSSDSATREIEFSLAIDRLVRLRRSPSAAWSANEERIAWTTDTVAIGGIVRSTLTEAITKAAQMFPGTSARLELAYALADILEYRVDLSRDLQPGDSIHVLVERQRNAVGGARAGNILAARLMVDGRRVEAVRFANTASRVQYFDAEGKAMRAAFLRAPLAFRRISSVFGLRKHPILGIWRAHQGTDYAAAAGTPVRAIGDGTVIYAGWKGGYGRVVEIRHRNGFVTRYGHLRAMAAGIRAGVAVSISKTIGFVGASGLATAPHLHFEVLVGGQHRDPRVALRNVTGDPLTVADRPAFTAMRTRLMARLDSVLKRPVVAHDGAALHEDATRHGADE